MAGDDNEHARPRMPVADPARAAAGLPIDPARR